MLVNYDVDYFDHLLRNTREYGESIARIRWDFVAQCKARTVLDYGCGVPWFRAFRPACVRVDTYDVAPFTQTGIMIESYDLVTFWDSLEHIPNLSIIDPVVSRARNIALAIPVLPPGKALETWKHFRPGEHLHYFDLPMLDAVFGRFGFDRIVADSPECPPREDIVDVIYERR